MESTITVARELFSNHDVFKLPQISSRRFTHTDLTEWLRGLESLGFFTNTPLGTSAEGRAIPHITCGSGRVKILLWSQMHGDEPTATMALLDLLNFFSRHREHQVMKTITANLTLHIIPMLNPDGAERFQRRTAQMLDMNRDALRLETPEGRLLKDLRDHLQPQFGFNLHDQDPRYTVGNSKKVSAIALLAPAFDDERSDNHIRRRAKQVAAVFAEVIENFIPGHVSKYDDSFEPRAFGDNIQRWGTSTVLVESGGWPDDREKMFIRKLNFVGLIASLFAIATEVYTQAPIALYDKLPFGTKFLFDVLLRNICLQATGSAPAARVDVGINVDEIAQTIGGIPELVVTIMDIGDLSIYAGLREVEMSEARFSAEEIYLERKMSAAALEQLMKKK